MTLNKFRTKKLIWDKAGKRIYESIEANSGDSNGRKLVVQVLDGGVIADLTGVQLYLSWKSNTSKHKGLDAFKAVDLSKGIFEIAYTTEMLSNVGKLRASLVLVDKVGRVESNLFTITVTRSNVDDDSVQSEDSFTALTEALVKVTDLEENYAPRLNEVTAQLAQTVEDVKDEITRRLGEFSVGTPLFADDASEMTDVNRIYLNLSDSFLYVHDGSSFVSTGVPYLSNSIEEYMTEENESWEVI